MDERNDNTEYFSNASRDRSNASKRRPSVRSSRQFQRGQQSRRAEDFDAGRVQVSGTIPASGTDRASMRPSWDRRTSWEQRPSWARQETRSDEPSRQDRHYQLDPVQEPPRPRPNQTMRQGTRPARGSYTQQAQMAWPDSEPIEQPNISRTRRLQIEAEEELAEARGRPTTRNQEGQSPALRVPMAGGRRRSFGGSRFQDSFATPRIPARGNIVQVAGQGIASFLRTVHPAMLLCVVAAAVLLVWGLGHFFSSGGRTTQQYQAPSYQSMSIINQGARPQTVAESVANPLVKEAENHKQKEFEERLGGFLDTQREYVSNVNLSGRDTFFRVGTSFPDNFASSDEKVVYLTFDDGPSGVTQQVLDILDRYDAKATFFVTNLMPEYQSLIGEAYQRGHTIGMHTSSHDYAEVYSSTDAFFADFQAISATVERQIGYVPCFMRFPGGVSNTISANYSDGIMTTLSEMVQYQGFQYYDWNCENGDARGSMSTQEIIDIALQAEYDAGTPNLIMLLHDANDKQTTVEALPTIIEHYMLKGYRFEALTPNSMVYHQDIFN